MPATISQVSQAPTAGRPCSVPLTDADLSLGNANWTKGLQSMSDWIWSGQLNPEAFPNHLARFFLQIPAVFEQQLNFSTTLIFDEPSFRNGVQASGFLPRVCRELVINYIGQQRRAAYTMTHHAVLSRLTFEKHGIGAEEFSRKLVSLLDYRDEPSAYEPHERAALDFAAAFCTDPKQYSDEQFEELREALTRLNRDQHGEQGLWLVRVHAARAARAKALAKGESEEEADQAAQEAADDAPTELSDELNERLINAQVIELAFLCLQFVALTDVFTSLAIPDEDFLPGVMAALVPAPVIERIHELIALGDADLPDLAPATIPAMDNPRILRRIIDGEVRVEPSRPPAPPRIPMTPYEGKDEAGQLRPAYAGFPDRDKGLSIGGIQVGVYGWGFGGHFPGSLVYALMHHPELSRCEAPYSLPVLFNEDEWRNGTQTGGFVTRRLKELVIQKIYKETRSRYGIEHHTMFLYNAFMDEYGVGREPRPKLTKTQVQAATTAARTKAREVTLWMHIHESAPRGVYTPLEAAALSWTAQIVRNPHRAHDLEQALREQLRAENEREIDAGLRQLDASPGIGRRAAAERLVNHQIAELAMLIGHMDGLGRALTILRLEAERPVQAIEGKVSADGRVKPTLDKDGFVQFTGYFNNRPGLHDVLRFVGLDDAVLTVNELMANPKLAAGVAERLEEGETDIAVDAKEAAKTAEL
jgi:alkylhydroperoxidase family enzyme